MLVHIHKCSKSKSDHMLFMRLKADTTKMALTKLRNFQLKQQVHKVTNYCVVPKTDTNGP